MKFATKKLRSPLKWHGGKSYLARRIVALFPPHQVYVEPFLGGGSILLNKDRAALEVAGDLDGKLMLFWSVMGSVDHFWRFLDEIKLTPYEEECFQHAKIAVDHSPPNPWEFEAITWSKFARFYLIRNRMSRGGLGKDFAWSDRLRGGQPGDVNAWKTILEELRDIHLRLQRVRLVPGNAVDLIRKYDAPDALIYVDPPYLHETRTAKKAYAYEMNRDQHIDLLEVLGECRGAVFLSGYRSPLYDTVLRDWKRIDFDMPNHSGQGETKQRRIECVWTNR